jgi:mRNA interferase RelE/StbE
VKSIAYARSALKTLRRIPANQAKRIIGKIEAYAADPESQANNVTSLKGRTGIRLRIGDWRVIMDDGVVLEVLEIGPRGGIYD